MMTFSLGLGHVNFRLKVARACEGNGDFVGFLAVYGFDARVDRTTSKYV